MKWWYTRLQVWHQSLEPQGLHRGISPVFAAVQLQSFQSSVPMQAQFSCYKTDLTLHDC